MSCWSAERKPWLILGNTIWSVRRSKVEVQRWESWGISVRRPRERNKDIHIRFIMTIKSKGTGTHVWQTLGLSGRKTASPDFLLELGTFSTLSFGYPIIWVLGGRACFSASTPRSEWTRMTLYSAPWVKESADRAPVPIPSDLSISIMWHEPGMDTPSFESLELHDWQGKHHRALEYMWIQPQIWDRLLGSHAFDCHCTRLTSLSASWMRKRFSLRPAPTSLVHLRSQVPSLVTWQ